MLLLTEADYDVLVAHDDPYSEYPHWRSAWREIQNRHKESEDRYWLMPPELDAVIRKAIGEYSDRCSFPCPEDHDALEVMGRPKLPQCARYPSRRKAGPRLNRMHYFGRLCVMASLLGFPNRPIGDSWGIGFSEADHGAHEVRLDHGA